ncbi:hypothetical protein BC936DRAFT_148413 [Jimgerdemannia flammicorona]|uniref:Uncharacterized protein n=1 Tax=Jimgerdemannia flammicorona TaxID=994334 RepID=A0A433DKL1_9FUNG|nr:hypothetical protein BC936DRAFT_148413 [Jimgerdemannia flammicorona]
MNRCDYLDPALAWVGAKDSGKGMALSKLAYEQLTRWVTIATEVVFALPKSFHLKLVTPDDSFFNKRTIVTITPTDVTASLNTFKWPSHPTTHHPTSLRFNMTTAVLHDYLKANYKEYEENTSRLDSLYSDFAPAKTSNRYGYDANVAFWKKLLIDTSRAGLLATNGDVLTLKTANLEEAFAWKGVGSPMGLACVLVRAIVLLWTHASSTPSGSEITNAPKTFNFLPFAHA